MTVDVVRTGSRGRPRHVSVNAGSESPEDVTQIHSLKNLLQQPAPTPKLEPQAPVVAGKPSPKPPTPKPKAAKPKSKPAKPAEEIVDEEDSDLIDIPRGITMRPSGKWVRSFVFVSSLAVYGVCNLITLNFPFNKSKHNCIMQESRAISECLGTGRRPVRRMRLPVNILKTTTPRMQRKLTKSISSLAMRGS